MQAIITHEETFEGKASTELALGCFTIGTLFFSLFLTLEDTSFIFIIGFIFIVMAVPINVIMFGHLIHNYLILPQHRKYIAVKLLILLSNIPVAFLYFNILHSHKII